jgi:hypothetical protein
LIPNEDRTPRNVAYFETSQGDGSPTSSPRRIRCLSVLFDPPYPRDLPPWKNPHIPFDRQLAAPDCSRDYSAGASHGECTIDRHSEQVVRRAWLRPLEPPDQNVAELIEPRLRSTRAAYDRRLRHLGLVEQSENVGLHQFHPFVIDEITLGERDDDLWNSEQLEDQEMLASLGHHSLIGGHYEKTEVDSARANQHAANEVFVAWNVDNSDSANTIEQQWREPKVDCNSSPFFLGQSIGIDTR